MQYSNMKNVFSKKLYYEVALIKKNCVVKRSQLKCIHI